MTEDFVWSDDERLKDGSAYGLGDGEYARLYNPKGSAPYIGLLVREGDTVRFLPVRERPKPLELKAGQRWRYTAKGSPHDGDEYLLAMLDGLTLVNLKGNGVWSSSDSPFGLLEGHDPREHGWTLLSDETSP